MRMFLRALMLLGLLAASCTTQATPPAIASPTQSTTPTTAASVAPTAKPAPTQYEASVLLSDARDVTALAVSDPLLVLAVNITGARPSDTRSSVAVMRLSGGSPTTLTGTEAVGVFVGGVAVFQMGTYFSREFGASPRDSGIFRPAATPPGSQAQPLVAGPGSPATLSPNGDGGPASAASLDRPAGIAFNTVGDLFIGESGAVAPRRRHWSVEAQPPSRRRARRARRSVELLGMRRSE